MAEAKPAALFIGPPKKYIQAGLAEAFALHSAETPEALADGLVAELAPHLRFIAVGGHPGRADSALMQRLGKLEIVANFGVGYDNVDAKWAAAHGIMVTNTPDVLNEEVADTAIALLLSTVRELPRAERYLRAGEWARQGDYRLTASLRDRTVGMIGLGRIGRVIAERLAAMKVPVVYHTRRPQPDVPYRHFADLVAMARAADVLLAIVPGGAATRHMINAEVLDALGPNGIVINMARGSVIDEEALIAALRERRILSAGLDVFADEPHVPQALIEMDHVVLTPHVGSGSEATRRAMEQLVVDNLVAWKDGRPPLTPVPETPWPRREP
jgi:lactate dehydrogenase-like 2-hydroxyacid dehydrogenase